MPTRAARGGETTASSVPITDASVGAPTLPFVGRVGELAVLGERLEAAALGRGTCVLVAGEPGIGKTRLAEEFVAVAADHGAMVVWSSVWESGGAPAFWPWTRLLSTLVELSGLDLDDLSTDDRQHLAAVLPALADGQPHQSDRAAGADRFAMFDAVSRLIRRCTAQRPAVLVLDDLHAADEPSLVLFRFISRDLRGIPVLLFGTYRDTDARARPGAGSLLAEAARDATVVRLGGLPADAVGELVAARCGTGGGTELAARISERTAGNPFFAQALLRMKSLVEAGSVPPDVRAAVRARLGQLDDPTREFLTVAAVIGREFHPVLVSDVLGLLEEELSTAVRRGCDGDLVELRDHDRVRFTHGLIQEVLYGDLEMTRRSRLHAQMVEVMEPRADAGADGVDHAQLAHHAVMAGSGFADRAVRHTRAAAEDAMAGLAFEEAVRNLQRAVEAAELAASPVESRAEILLDLGDAHLRSGDLDRARENYRLAGELARTHGLVDVCARAALGYGTRVSYRLAGDTELIAFLEQAREVIDPTDHPLRHAVALRYAIELLWRGDTTDGRGLIDEVADAPDLPDDPVTNALLNTARRFSSSRSTTQERLRLLEQTLEASRGSADHETELVALTSKLSYLLALGERSAADRTAETHQRLATDRHDPWHRWWAIVHRAMFAVLDGDLETADGLVEEALEQGRRLDGGLAAMVWVPARFLVDFERDRIDPDRLRHTLGALAGSEALDIPVFAAGFAYCDALLGATAPLERLLDEAHANGFGDVPDDPTAPGWWFFAAEGAVLLQHTQVAHALLERLRPLQDEAIPGGNFAVFQTYSYCLGRLEALAGRGELAAADLDRSLRLCHRLRAPLMASWTRLARARLLVEHEDPQRRRDATITLDDLCRTADDRGWIRLARACREVVEGASPAEPASAGGWSSSSSQRHPGAPAVDGGPPSAADVTLRREGEYWTVARSSGAVRLQDVKGFTYLAQLIANPGVAIHATELVSEVGVTTVVARPDGLQVAAGGGVGPALDAQAKAAYRQRLDDLRAEIDEAESFHDPERAARARAERQFLVDELSRAVGLGGRDRPVASRAERARVSATKAIKTAIRKIGEQDVELAEDLAAAVRTGTFCTYQPLAGARQWQVLT